MGIDKQWVKGLNTKIKYVHLHNNDGITDGHFGLCGGAIDMQSVLDARNLRTQF